MLEHKENHSPGSTTPGHVLLVVGHRVHLTWANKGPSHPQLCKHFPAALSLHFFALDSSRRDSALRGISGPGSAVMSSETGTQMQTRRAETHKACVLLAVVCPDGKGIASALALPCQHIIATLQGNAPAQQLMSVFAVPLWSVFCVNNVGRQAQPCLRSANARGVSGHPILG